jgi:hypothetical protein
MNLLDPYSALLERASTRRPDLQTLCAWRGAPKEILDGATFNLSSKNAASERAYLHERSRVAGFSCDRSPLNYLHAQHRLK